MENKLDLEKEGETNEVQEEREEKLSGKNR